MESGESKESSQKGVLMEEPKLIARYAHFKHNTTIASGVFTATLNKTLTVQPTPITLFYVNMSCFARDNVTSQLIKAMFRVDVEINAKRDNPSLQTPDSLMRLFCSSDGETIRKMHYNLSAGEAFLLDGDFYLYTVTANVISVEVSLTFGYWVPEDYMSVEGMVAAIPG